MYQRNGPVPAARRQVRSCGLAGMLSGIIEIDVHGKNVEDEKFLMRNSLTCSIIIVIFSQIYVEK